MKKMKITFNSPAILTFGLLCAAVTLLNILTEGYSNPAFFSTYRSSWKSVWTYVRLFTHVFGHSGWKHYLENATYLLLLGPLLEEKYGSKLIWEIIGVVALVTALVNTVFFPSTSLMGASGICFALILLSSFAGVKSGQIPITFFLVSIIFIGQQVNEGLFSQDNVANLAHIIGGIVGAVFGFACMKKS